jgi:phosphoglycolate phosphatase-like HAD superfamily hydrolase
MGVILVGYTENMEPYTIYRLKRLRLDGTLSKIFTPKGHDIPAHIDPEWFQYHRFFESTLEHTERRHTPEGHFKPDPAILSTIMEEFHITPTRTLYVGDSLMKDVSMAQRAGVHEVHALMSVFKNGAVRLCPRQRWPVRMGAQGRRQGL